MRMPNSSVIAAIACAFAAMVFAAIWFAASSCFQPSYMKLIDETAGGYCVEFWLNRYQAFIAALIALLGAAVTVNTMWRQTEATRADEAERRMARYSSAFLDAMIQYTDLEPMRSNEAIQDAKPRYEIFDAATNVPAIREAMIDAVLGPDWYIVGTFVDRMRLATLTRFYAQPDPLENAISVDPLFKALCSSIVQRQELLREGASVFQVSKIAFIDAEEVAKAHTEKRVPRIL